MINSSFLYHGFGLYNHICTSVSYKGNTIIFNVESKERLKCCPKCGCRHLVKNGFRYRDFIGLPIGGKKTIFRMKVQRYKCKNESCDYDQQEPIPFAAGSQTYTYRFATYVVCLLKSMTIRAVSDLLMVGWDTIKDIHLRFLERRYMPISLKGVKNIGIDEFAVKKGHVYKTIVVDLDTGRIIYVADGKDAACLNKFWKMVKRQHATIEHVATDLSGAFIKAVSENCPDAQHIFDHFHVQKLMNEKVDDTRRAVCRTEKDVNKRKVIMGVRLLLLKNGKDVMDKYYKTRLDNALAMNEPLSKAYYLKEGLREIWMQISKEDAEAVLEDWCKQARESKVPQMIQMANTIMGFRTGILAWYDCHISTAKVEGTNNKIKVLKRTAYGFRDDKYFDLRLYALHDCRITRNVG